MEVERARLLSLAYEFGFDEDAANQCLDRLLDLYGETLPHRFLSGIQSERANSIPPDSKFELFILFGICTLCCSFS